MVEQKKLSLRCFEFNNRSYEALVKRIWTLLLMSAIVCNINGCSFSFYSNQYRAAKALIETIGNSNNDAPGSSDWALNWGGYEFETTAVNVGDEIWFVNSEDMVVRFDGWQVTGVDNVFPAETKIATELIYSSLVILENGKRLITYSCKPWSSRFVENSGDIIYEQKCMGDNENFDNSIYVTKDKQISKMNFHVHPNYPSISLQKISN